MFSRLAEKHFLPGAEALQAGGGARGQEGAPLEARLSRPRAGAPQGPGLLHQAPRQAPQGCDKCDASSASSHLFSDFGVRKLPFLECAPTSGCYVTPELGISGLRFCSAVQKVVSS